MIVAERAARLEAEAELANARAEAALIAYYRLEIEKLRRQLYGTRSERKARLLEQMELQLEELEATATEDELAAEKAAAQTQTVRAFQRQRSSRKPFPAHLPRERVVIAAPESCPCCGSRKLSKLGEDVTETLEVIPRRCEGGPDGPGEVLLPGLRGGGNAGRLLEAHIQKQTLVLCWPDSGARNSSSARQTRPHSRREQA